MPSFNSFPALQVEGYDPKNVLAVQAGRQHMQMNQRTMDNQNRLAQYLPQAVRGDRAAINQVYAADPQTGMQLDQRSAEQTLQAVKMLGNAARSATDVNSWNNAVDMAVRLFPQSAGEIENYRGRLDMRDQVASAFLSAEERLMQHIMGQMGGTGGPLPSTAGPPSNIQTGDAAGTMRPEPNMLANMIPGATGPLNGMNGPPTDVPSNAPLPPPPTPSQFQPMPAPEQPRTGGVDPRLMSSLALINPQAANALMGMQKPQQELQDAGPKAYNEAIAKQDAEQYVKLLDGGSMAGRKIAQLQRLEALFANTPQGAGMNTVVGAKAALRTALQLFSPDTKLEDLGITDNTSFAQAAKPIINQMALALRNPAGGEGMPGAMSDADRNFLMQSIPSLENVPEGNALMIDYMRRLAQRDLQVSRMARDFARQNGGRFDRATFEDQIAQWSADNPVFTDDDMAKVQGIVGRSGAQQQTGPQPAQVQPGTVEDGYRFKGGNPADASSWERVQ